MKTNQLPLLDRPREKLARYGSTKLSNSELLAMLLGTGLPGQNSVELARKILTSFGSHRLTTATVDDLQAHCGLGASKAAAVVASFELGRRLLKERPKILLFAPKDVWSALRQVRSSKKEHFIAFYLDSSNQLIAQEVISIGTIESSMVHPREVFEPAVKYLASQVILAHNHPNGQLEPSSDDLLVTDRLVQAGHILGIEVVDHVIVTTDHYLSLRDGQLL